MEATAETEGVEAAVEAEEEAEEEEAAAAVAVLDVASLARSRLSMPSCLRFSWISKLLALITPTHERKQRGDGRVSVERGVCMRAVLVAASCRVMSYLATA